ncbi:MAG: hypothetical protein M1546_00410 [Chloroflexi bacterium]|nr:hypothetical protein [Chloroflexota bacterium]
MEVVTYSAVGIDTISTVSTIDIDNFQSRQIVVKPFGWIHMDRPSPRTATVTALEIGDNDRRPDMAWTTEVSCEDPDGIGVLINRAVAEAHAFMLAPSLLELAAAMIQLAEARKGLAVSARTGEPAPMEAYHEAWTAALNVIAHTPADVLQQVCRLAKVEGSR